MGFKISLGYWWIVDIESRTPFKDENGRLYIYETEHEASQDCLSRDFTSYEVEEAYLFVSANGQFYPRTYRDAKQDKVLTKLS